MHTCNTVRYLGIEKRTWALETVAYVGELCEGPAVEFSDAVGTEAVETQGVARNTREHQHRAPVTATGTTKRQYHVQERTYVSSERESLKNRGTGREEEMGREGGREGKILIK